MGRCVFTGSITKAVGMSISTKGHEAAQRYWVLTSTRLSGWPRDYEKV